MANNELQNNKKQLSVSERFVKTVMREAGETLPGQVDLTEYQKGLIQGYYLQIDSYFRDTQRNKSNYNWNQVDMTDLAIQSIKYSRLGLDMFQENTLHIVPYRKGNTGKIVVDLQLGYNGRKYLALTYAIKPIADVQVELVFENDEFEFLGRNEFEHKIKNPFNRGEIIGGYGFIEYKDGDKKLILVSLEDLDARRKAAKTDYIWKAWPKEMYFKTLCNIVFSQRNIPLDPRKIGDEMEYIRSREAEKKQAETQFDIDENANSEELDFTVGEAEYVENPTTNEEEVEDQTNEETPAEEPGMEF